MTEDWRYSDEKMKLRQEVLSILLQKYGGELHITRKSKYTCQSIYQCAHDWVSQGHKISSGVVKYYEAYYGNN